MKVSSGTIIRTVVLLLALINQVLTAIGKNPLPFSEDQVYQAITSIVTVWSAIFAWWKNNSFTTSAMLADEYMEVLRKDDEHENI